MSRISRNQITDFLENTLVEVFERTHKCKWYKRHKYRGDKFYYERIKNHICDETIVYCKRCGKSFDVTNYNK